MGGEDGEDDKVIVGISKTLQKRYKFKGSVRIKVQIKGKQGWFARVKRHGEK